ncbi:DUF2911 domain-containing protein [Chitinophaga pinensis]|uniref:DUF2911 domain-containing protein n=1 Tax=Chitinophaga pinensis (strain ATCC 43595 / DSM 2588 / LMG 13176 / NBRC 15968 / NCIMB 11800 / UQM 2034) TaxID=485918 RepID=A0A979G8U1_CHIPD|nr:DUF2911 domain-containing protein [Chitinophaga pinensis]ACU62906.1 conserved hypothetical protein [Chitinophaga pinensis DSM 2588]
MKPLFRYLSAGCSLLLCAQLSFAQGVKMPAPSPGQTIHQDFALSFVEVNYSRPAIKGRKVMGDLVPFDKVWRTGANGATVITFGDDVKFGGTEVKAGKYGLLTIPGKSEWTVILTKSLDVTSPAAYKPENDVVRVKVKPTSLPYAVENFMITFDDIESSSANLLLIWEKTMVSVPLTAEVDSKVVAQLDAAMKGDKKPYFQAASYYYETNRDLKQALVWVEEAVKENPTAFWIATLKARIQAKSGDKKAAKATAEKAIELAKTAKNDDYVVINQKIIASL